MTGSHLARTVACLTGGLAMLVVSASPALAHIDLVDSSPEEGQRLRSAPSVVVLNFNEPVAADFAQANITVTGGRAQPVPAQVSGRTVRVGLERVSPGTPPGRSSEWILTYRVVSRDGHPVQGAVNFNVREPSEKESPARASSNDEEVRPDTPESPARALGDPSGSSSTERPLLLGGGVVALGGLALLVWWARRG